MFSLKVSSIDIAPGRMSVRLSIEGEMYTSDALARKVLSDRPNLAFHSCRNSHGAHFGDAIAGTSIPHLLEHLIIDEQLRAEPEGSSRIFAGNTEWLDGADALCGNVESPKYLISNNIVRTCRDCREARVEVSFADDMVALGSLAGALAYLEELQRDETARDGV